MSRPVTHRSAGFAAALSGLLLPAVLSAATYRWVDETGITVYSQSVPTDVQAQRLDTVPTPPRPPTPASLPTQTEQPAASGPAHTEGPNKDQEGGKKTAADKANEKADRKKNCQVALRNLDTLQNLGTRLLRFPDGTVERPTEEQLKARMQETKEQVKEFCK